MQELEKILEEIKAHAIEFEVFGTSDDYISVGWVNDIIRRHMKNEEDILKFYYCESEDDYYLGQRVQNMYYARYADGVFTWFMSRHLPWGKRVTAPETTWKEYTYPTEPKEIPFTEWLDGFIRKHINDGWIPVEERLPEAGERVIATIKHHAWISDYDQNWVPESEKTMHQEYTESCEAVMTKGDIWSYRCKEDDYDIDTASAHPGKSLAYPIAEVIAWRPLPEPYRSANKTEASDWRKDMLRKFDRREIG